MVTHHCTYELVCQLLGRDLAGTGDKVHILRQTIHECYYGIMSRWSEGKMGDQVHHCMLPAEHRNREMLQGALQGSRLNIFCLTQLTTSHKSFDVKLHTTPKVLLRQGAHCEVNPQVARQGRLMGLCNQMMAKICIIPPVSL